MTVPTPRNLSIELVNDDDNRLRFYIGDCDLSRLLISTGGPIIELINAGDGVDFPLYRAWVPVFFEGTINDPLGMTRPRRAKSSDHVGECCLIDRV